MLQKCATGEPINRARKMIGQFSKVNYLLNELGSESWHSVMLLTIKKSLNELTTSSCIIIILTGKVSTTGNTPWDPPRVCWLKSDIHSTPIRCCTQNDKPTDDVKVFHHPYFDTFHATLYLVSRNVFEDQCLLEKKNIDMIQILPNLLSLYHF